MSEVANITPSAFEAIKPKFLQLVDEKTFAKEVSYACMVLAKNSYLAGATKSSIQQSVLNVAQVGLSLDPVRKLAYLVPRYNRALRAVECCLEPSYQGLVKLMTDTGSIVSMSAQLIWEGDEVDIDLASAEKVRKHTPYLMTGKDKGLLKGVYSLAILHDGSRQVELMSTKDVYEIRERSESYKKAKEKPEMSSIWITDEGEMFRKTVIRRHYKYLPKSEAFEKVSEAVKLDESDYTLSDAQWSKIDRLLHTAHIPDDKRTEIERNMHTYTTMDASMVIEYLAQNQPSDFVKQLGDQARRA